MQGSRLLAIAFFGLVSCGPLVAVADGLPPSDALAAPPGLPTAAPEPRDPRLPPLYPGESISRGNGKRMKVWTTAGPVESQLTKPQTATVPNSTSVILDARSATGGVVGRSQNPSGQTNPQVSGNAVILPSVPVVGQTGLDYRALHGDSHGANHADLRGAEPVNDGSLGEVPEKPAAVRR